MARRILIMGAPGAGKGTQARRLSRAHGIPHISTGDIFRVHVESQTELGRKIEEHMRNGHLVPDALAGAIVASRLSESDCKRGYVLDGYPRSMPQAEDLDRLLEQRNEALNLVLNLDVDDEELVERLTNRRSCPNCGRIYNLKFKPPQRDEICDLETCRGARLIHRDDDREDTIRERLRVYHDTTKPIINFYREKDILRTVGGSYLSPDDITVKIEDIMSAPGVA